MASVARMKLANLLIAALKEEGITVNGMYKQQRVADDIWVQSGGATKLDVARWGAELNCIWHGNLCRIQVSSFLTLTAASKMKKITFIHHSGRDFEV